MSRSFGRYELLDLLGRGGMGEVYRARDTVRQRDVALKLLPDHLATDERFLARFRRESRLAAQLSEPHIIPIHDFGEIDGRLFIDMRLVLGADLGSLIEQRGPLATVVAVDILGQIASALDAAHADALVHRDVKPSNVMLTGLSADLEQRLPFAYLVDFGIARSTEQMTALTDTSSATIGTVAYMSPERINGDVGDGRGDVYALACVLFEALAGVPPFVGELVPLIYQHMNAEPPRVSERAPSVPRALDDVIAKGLAKDPAARYATAGDLALAARRALQSAGTASIPAAGRPRPSPATRPRPQPTGQSTRVGPGSWPAPVVPVAPAPAPVVPLAPAPAPVVPVAPAPVMSEPPRPVSPPAVRADPVTLLFAEFEGSSPVPAAGERHADLVAAHRRVLGEVWAAHGGVEAGTGSEPGGAGLEQGGAGLDQGGAGFDQGGAGLVAFPDTAAAVSAAADAQRRLAGVPAAGNRVDGIAADGTRLRVRIGVHAGAPRRRGASYWGPDVRYGVRLCAAARGGQVLVSDTARAGVAEHVFESLGRHALADFPTPRELFHLVVDGRGAGDFAAPRTVDAPRTTFPSAAGPLIGRGAELDDLARRLTGGHRLVTLTGPAGSGRTRLSVEVGEVLAARFESVWFVSLDVVGDARDVVPAVAHTLGLPDLDGADPFARLLEVLRDRRVLLVLDDAGHVTAAAAEIARLVASNPGLHVLLTSDTPLRVAAEHVVALAPLAVPPDPAHGADAGHQVAALTSAPAAQLLLERAAAAGSSVGTGLADDVALATALARLCRQLDGLPLALELAAARLTGRAPVGLPDPTGPGLRPVLEWSVGLLAPAERRLLGLLAGFAGSFPLDLVESAFGASADGLAALVDVGLVRAADDGRFVVRPPVRRYAAELAAAGDDPYAGPRAVADALARAAEWVEPLWMLREGDGRSRLHPEQANILVALNWTATHDVALHLRLATSTAWLLTRSGLAVVSRGHLERAFERASDPHARARCAQALALLDLGTPDPAGSLAAADLWRDLGDPDREVMSLAHAADVYARTGVAEAALAAIDRAGVVAARCSDPDAVTWLLGLLRAQGWSAAGRHDEARPLAQGLLAATGPGTFRRLWALTVAAAVALAGASPAEALTLSGAAMQLLERFDDLLGRLAQAGAVAGALVQLGRVDDAVTVLAICEAVHAELSWPMPVQVVVRADHVRAEVGPERLASARARAASYSTPEALSWVARLARSEAQPPR